jgi:hypothetical protein
MSDEEHIKVLTHNQVVGGEPKAMTMMICRDAPIQE